jgi:hypothetical protein
VRLRTNIRQIGRILHKSWLTNPTGLFPSAAWEQLSPKRQGGYINNFSEGVVSFAA